MIVLMDHPPRPAEAARLVAAGCTELRFPYASEALVGEAGGDLGMARDALEAAGVDVGVRWPGGVS